MKLIKFEKQHYELLCDWWTKHNHKILPFEMLSPFGLVFVDGDKPIAVSFIYFVAGCELSQIAWTTTDPGASVFKRHEAVKACIEGLVALARKFNHPHVVCFSSSRGLTRLIQKAGLKKLSEHDMLYSHVGVF